MVDYSIVIMSEEGVCQRMGKYNFLKPLIHKAIKLPADKAIKLELGKIERKDMSSAVYSKTLKLHGKKTATATSPDGKYMYFWIRR